jgi:hypothetical protein
VSFRFVLQSLDDQIRWQAPTPPSAAKRSHDHRPRRLRTRWTCIACHCRRRNAATVQRVGGSAHREVRGRGDGSSHGFSARSGGALLGFGDALKIF